MSNKLTPFAACVVLIRNEKILSVSRKDDLTSFGLPGGKIDSNESSKAAAARELLEETGIKINEEDLTLIYSGNDSTGKLVDTYLAKDNEQDPQQIEAGIIRWSTWDELCTGIFGDYNREVKRAILDKIITVKISLLDSELDNLFSDLDKARRESDAESVAEIKKDIAEIESEIVELRKEQDSNSKLPTVSAVELFSARY